MATDLSQIYAMGAADFRALNVSGVMGYRSVIAGLAGQALVALNITNGALGALNQYNDNVLCWSS